MLRQITMANHTAAMVYRMPGQGLSASPLHAHMEHLAVVSKSFVANSCENCNVMPGINVEEVENTDGLRCFHRRGSTCQPSYQEGLGGAPCSRTLCRWSAPCRLRR